jgi:hypothetical protein
MTVVILRQKYLEKFSREFVDTYEKEGDRAAALNLMPKIKDEEHDSMRELIMAEFRSRGYTFPEDNNGSE